MIDYKQANSALADAYQTRVPDFNLTPVLELITGIDPSRIAAVMAEAIISLADELLLGNRRSNVRTQEMMEVFKNIYRAFEGIEFDRQDFYAQLEQQIKNDEGIYAREPDIDYPLRVD